MKLLDRDCDCMFRLKGQGSTASAVDGLGFGGLNGGCILWERFKRNICLGDCRCCFIHLHKIQPAFKAYCQFRVGHRMT